MARKRVCVVVTARPSWAKLQTICEAIQAHPDLELQIVACASALLERYGRVVDVIKSQGFEIAAEVWSTYEGANLVTSAKETGALLHSLADVLHRLRPDVVLLCADRHEVLAVAQAASYLHLSTAHVQGGERTGSIDDRVRDAVTALSDIHFPCTELAALRVWGLTGSSRIHWVGCSSLDLARRAQQDPPVTVEEVGGAGASLDLSQPFAVILQHPVTSEAEYAHAQIWHTLIGSERLLPRVVLWPGQDAGADGLSKAIREYQDRYGTLHTVRNLPPARFLKLLTQAAVLVGNSSAGIREASFLGVPVVDIGTRQWGRERASNVRHASYDSAAIATAMRAQIAHGRYPSSTLYGTGNTGQQIAEVLAHGTDDRVDSGAQRLQGHSGQELPSVR